MDRVIEDVFEPKADNSDSGWVSRAGVGAFQLRVGQHPGSQEPLVRAHMLCRQCKTQEQHTPYVQLRSSHTVLHCSALYFKAQAVRAQLHMLDADD